MCTLFQSQRKALINSFVFIYLPSLALLFAIAIVTMNSHIKASSIMRDTTAAAGVPFYFGALSMIGILMWCAAAAICILTYFVLQGTNRKKSTQRFFLCSGVFGIILTIDDAFLFHEIIGPFKLGIPSPLTFAIYGLLFISLIAFHWDILLQSDYILLLIAAVFFASSVLIDLGHDILSFHFYASDFIEDGCKFLGTAGWLSYFATLTFKKLSEPVRSSSIAREVS